MPDPRKGVRKRKACALYSATCLTNGHVYIGISVCPLRRWKQHCKSARKNPTVPFSSALAKHGAEGFFWEIHAWYPSTSLAGKAEEDKIAELRSQGTILYNATKGGWSEYSADMRRERMSQTKLGRKMSDEHRAKMLAAVRTPEARAAAADRMRGTKQSQETIAKASLSKSIAFSGHTVSEETRMKISQTLRTRNRTNRSPKRPLPPRIYGPVQQLKKPRSVEAREKMRQAKLGKKLSPEHAAKKKAACQTAEHRAKLSAVHLARCERERAGKFLACWLSGTELKPSRKKKKAAVVA